MANTKREPLFVEVSSEEIPRKRGGYGVPLIWTLGIGVAFVLGWDKLVSGTAVGFIVIVDSLLLWLIWALSQSFSAGELPDDE